MVSEKHRKQIIIGATIVSLVVTFYVLNKHLSHKNRLQRLSKKDLKKWEGKKETDASVSDELVSYWKLAGFDFTYEQMQSSSTHSSYPWSAVYISKLVKDSGVKNFTPRSTHAGYTVDAKNNRSDKVKKSYWAFKPSELKKVEVGDIIVKGRSGTNPNLDTINSSVKTHGDIVVDIKKIDGQKFAITQGGNVSNTVKQTRVPLTDNERLLNPVHFAQLKYIA